MEHWIKPKDVARYHADALTWDQNRVRAAVRSRNFAWLVSGVACVLTLGSVVAVIALAPLKRVDAFVIKVDRSTGATEVVTALKGIKPVAYEEAVSKYFLSRYVILREGWVFSAARENYVLTSLMSTPEEQKRLTRAVDLKNPNSPQIIYGANRIVDIKIHSVSFINPSVAQVRYTKTIQSSSIEPTATNWVSVMTFAYSSAPESEADRLANPLGFQVSTFRTDPEA